MYHVLRRQLTPRHSPSALVAFDLCCRELVASRVTVHDVSRHLLPTRCLHHRAFFTLLFSSSYSLVKERVHPATSKVSLHAASALSTTDTTTRHSRRVAQTDRRLSLNSRLCSLANRQVLQIVCPWFRSRLFCVCPANVGRILIAPTSTVKGDFQEIFRLV